MPAFFTCPKCHEKNYGYKEPPTKDTYCGDMRCKRCGQKGIYWVANKEMADGVAQQRKISPSLITIGVGQSEIGYMDPSVATGNVERIVPRMAPYATLVSPFSQSDRHKAFTPQAKDLTEGHCAGQCLHWIRRVIQGGRETYEIQKQKGTVTRTDEDIATLQKRQHLKAATTYMIFDKHREKAPRDHAADLEKKLEEIKREAASLLTSNGITKTGNQWNCTPDQEDFLNAVLAKRDEELKKVRSLNEQGFYSYAWKPLAQQLDQQVLNRSKVSKRPFGNVVAVKCLNQSTGPFGNGDAGSFASAVVGDSEFQLGRCAQLAIGRIKSTGVSGGHAIAVHYKSACELYLFDPNLGIFCSKSKDNLRRAIETLLGVAWPELNPPWIIDGTFGYAIFRAVTPQQAKKPSEKAVDYSAPSPKFTAVKNTAIGAVPSTQKTASSTPKPSAKSTVKSGGATPTKSGGTTIAKSSDGPPSKFAPQSPPQKLGPATVGKTSSKVAALAKKLGQQQQHA